jgi:hypothetical protein
MELLDRGVVLQQKFACDPLSQWRRSDQIHDSIRNSTIEKSYRD